MRRIGGPRTHGCLKERQCSTYQFGLRNCVLQHEPGGFGAVRTYEVCPRPANRLDDAPQASSVSFMDAGHPRLIPRFEEFAGVGQFGSRLVVQPSHLQ